MKGGRGFRRQLRGPDLAPVGQEFDLVYASLTEWCEVQHTVDGAHTHITAETLDVDNVTKFGGRWLMPQSAVITPPYTVTADQNDYAPRNIEKAIVLRVSTDASRTFTGLKTNKDEFRWLLWINVGNFDQVFYHNSASSLDPHRFACPLGVDVTIGSGASVLLWYDAHASNWRIVASSGDVTGVTSGALVADGDYGDITVSVGGTTFTIDADVVSNSKLANMAAWTFKARNTSSSGDPQDMALGDVTEDAALDAGDYLLGFESGGAIRKFGQTAITSGVGGHLHGVMRVLGDGTTTTFNLLDIAEYIEFVSHHGAVVDPATYTLSADGSQVTFDDTPMEDTVQTINYVIAGI